MGARKTKGTKDNPWTEQTRERIRSSMILNRLIEHVLGTVEMSATQVNAATRLLDKILPSLQSIEGEMKTEAEFKWIGPAPMSSTEWEDKFSPDDSRLN